MVRDVANVAVIRIVVRIHGAGGREAAMENGSRVEREGEGEESLGLYVVFWGVSVRGFEFF